MFPFSWIRENEVKVNPHFGSYASLVWELIESINMVDIK